MLVGDRRRDQRSMIGRMGLRSRERGWTCTKRPSRNKPEKEEEMIGLTKRLKKNRRAPPELGRRDQLEMRILVFKLRFQ